MREWKESVYYQRFGKKEKIRLPDEKSKGAYQRVVTVQVDMKTGEAKETGRMRYAGNFVEKFYDDAID